MAGDPGLQPPVKTFYIFFVDKVATIRSHITPPAYDPSVPPYSSVVFDHVEPVSLCTLAEIVSHLKPPVFHLNIIPSRLFTKKSLTLLDLMF